MNSSERRDLKKELWGVLNTYRRSGRMLDRDVVIHAAALLFLRWADFYEAEQTAIAEFELSHYTSALRENIRWSILRQQDPRDLMRIFQRELVPSLKYAHLTPLAKHLHCIGVALEQSGIEHSESLSTLEPVLELFCWIDSLPFDSASDRAATGSILEILLSDFIVGKDTGQFTTPQPIADLMIELADPKPGDRIYDPCFGMGGLLVAGTRRLQEQAKFLSPRNWLEIQESSIFGVEINPIAYAIGMTRVVLAGIDYPNLELGDTLERGVLRNRASEGFDCILAVPPWGQRSTSFVYRNEFPIPTQTTEALFLQHIMASLRPGGRAVVAFPDGIFFRLGAEKQIRQRLLSEFYVEGVLALPPGAFTPFTAINSNLLVFRRDKPASSVRFFLVEDFPSGLRKREALLPAEQQLFAKQVAQTFREDKPGTHLWNTPITTLAERDWELLVKRTGDDALAEQLKTLTETDPEIKLRSLEQVAEVFVGISYTQDLIAKDAKHPDVLAGLLRVSDVKDTGAKAPQLFLTQAGQSKTKDKHYLRPLDIIVTRSGTIGKVSLISDVPGTVGAIATQGLVIIRPKEGITAQFLAELLRSPVYQSWLKGHSRGATIQHLSMEALKNLKVPVPPIQIQNRLWQGTHGRISDALSALVRMVIGASDDPVLNWLEQSKTILAIAEITDDGESKARLLWFDRFGKELYNLRNRGVHEIETVPAEIMPWLITAATAAAALRGIHEIPDGTGRLAVLENAHRRIKDALELLNNASVAVVERAREVSLDTIKLITHEIESTLAVVEIEMRLEPSSIAVGIPNEVALLIQNKSSVAIRNLTIQTNPEIGSGKIQYLRNADETKISLLVEPQQAFGIFNFNITWTASRLDGTSVVKQLPLTLAIRSIRELNLSSDLGTSPYIVASPVDRKEMFFGRNDVIEQIKRQLSTSKQANVILIEGNRRTGKTSILKQLQKPEILPNWILVDCSFQGAEGHHSKVGILTQDVYRLMARKIGWACHHAGVNVWLPGQSTSTSNRPFNVQFISGLKEAFSADHPFETLELYLQSVLVAIQPRRLLLMLDEFDKLQEGIDSGITSPQVPENIRYLLHEYPNLSAIITGSRRLKRLREEYWSALFGIGQRIGISALPLEAARALVTAPVEGKLIYLPEARDRIVELCARQPFLIQTFCNIVFEYAARSGERTITPSHIEKVVNEMAGDNEHFQTLWGYAATDRRRMILALCDQLAVGDDPVNLALLEVKFEEASILVPQDSDLGSDLELLRELELIELDPSDRRGSSYTLTIPLMGEWIRRNVDFADLKRKAIKEAEEEL
ncbi:N-6 DNA methylase [Nostoc sp.]|uniref:N-6 DNA methylase n=1 Tax=Nostoc sp. TaxID=1180 RepID=UPI002FF54B73